MHRMLRQLWTCHRGQSGLRASSVAAHVLVHACGEVLLGADGEPMEFPSAESADRFARKFLCEPAFTRRAMRAPCAA